MSKKRSTRRALFTSALAILLCISMLMGSTFAWFTDGATSGGNIIQSGTLDLQMYWTDDLSSGNWYDVEDDAYNTIFSYDKWEPGYTDVKYIKLVNNGNLALNYQLALTPQGSVGKLAEVINVLFADSAVDISTREDLSKLGSIGFLSNVMNGNATAAGTLLPAGTVGEHPAGEVIVTMAMTMITTAGNEYQDETSGAFTITALATQATYEKDSFGNTYDQGAEFPQILTAGQASVQVTPEDGKVPVGGVTMTDGNIAAFVPGGAKLENGANKLTLKITPLEDTTSDITVVNNEILIPVDVHIEGLAADNTVPAVIDLGEVLPKYLNMGNYRLIHVENGTNAEMTLVSSRDALTAHNSFTYDPLTGAVSVAMATFSEVALVADTTNAWEGKFDYSWYTNAVAPVDGATGADYIIANADQLAAFGAIVGGMNGQTQDSFKGKTVKLISDINLGDAEKANNPNIIFYPIGYYNSEGTYERTNKAITSGLRNFEGTFDGQGHTIANFYQNTWEMKGDHDWYSPEEQYYRDGMGLFGKVYGGTVKNLTVNNFKSDGEIATTGCVAAYAEGATFENIAITNCNPRVYNIGNGGIVGCVGWYAKEANLKTSFKNITVDNTNKISALWGSYDVACGGIVGQYYPTSGQTGSPKNAGIELINCHVSAQMDVYNDVCGNYQYYAYRYAGMIIGSIRENTTTVINGVTKTIPDMTGISAENCTVNYGDWNDYYYCEFEKNGHPSYSGPNDYKFSRVPHSELEFTDSNGNGLVDADERASVTGCKHNHTAAEDNKAIYLPFHQLFTGYSWGVSSIGLKEYSGIVTDLDITEGDQEESVEKFETKFTGDFLYRVGTENAVSVETLFQAAPKLDEDGNELKDDNGNTIYWDINSPGVHVSVTSKLNENEVMGSYIAPTSDMNKDGVTDWKDGQIEFKKTGIVKVTIQDYNFCTPTELYLEVVAATNHSAASISSLGSGNVVLLCDTKLNANGALALQNATLYGNGFEIDATEGRTTGESVTANYLLYLNNGILDNVQVRGAVYTNFDVISSNSWNNPTVLSLGNSKIVNSQISNCASPVRVRSGNLEIKESTLKGGFFANLDIRGGNVVLDNVTTINQVNLNEKASNGKEIAGLGIVFYYEGPSNSTTLEIRNNLTQHNYIAETYTDNSYAKMLVEEIFNNSAYASLVYTDDNGVKWANTGVLSLSDQVIAENIVATKQSNKDIYTGMTVQYKLPGALSASKGYLYTTQPSKPADDYNDLDPDQFEIIPKVSFDHKVNEMIKTDGSESSCTFDQNTDSETITFANGDSFTWNTRILKCSNKEIAYTVWMDGVQCGDSITFEDSGKHTIVFKYVDHDNYRKNANGEIEKYSVEYETSMEVIVNEKAQTAKSAEITFPLLDSYGTTKVTVDGKTYIMPNLSGTTVPKYGDDLTFDTSTRKYGSLKSDGRASVDVYYPIIKTDFSGNYMVYPVFGNKNGTLVQIQDYNENGTVAATPYNASTQTMPSNLSVSRGYTVQWSIKRENKTPVVGSGSMSYGSWVSGLTCMKYQSSSDNIQLAVKNGYLSYYPNIGLSSNDREEQVQVVEYKYVDNKGDTYYYCVGYHIEENKNGYAFGEIVEEDSGDDCVTGDTLVTLADGTQKRIDQITYQDQLLVWDFFNGCYAVTTPSVIFNHGDGVHKVTNLQFSDGTVVKVIGEHEFFDAKANSFVYISQENVSDYIGHEFIKADGGTCTTVTLEKYFFTEEETGKYTILTAKYNNAIVEGMLSLTPDPTNKCEDFFRLYAVGESMKYDEKKMQADIEKYGLFVYEDLAAYVTYEEFVAFNGEFYKILVGKGLITVEDIAMALATYAPNH